MTERALHCRVKREQGFTLIELMITLTVIGIGVLALSGVQTRASNEMYASGRQERALALAQERIEVARGAGFTGVVPEAGQSGVFAWRTRVDTLSTDLKQIGVTVSWNESALSRSLQLNTLVSAR